MNADAFNRWNPVGSRVVAYPGARPSDPAAAPSQRLITRTRSKAGPTGFGKDAVMVEGYAAGIALTHVDPICGSQCADHDHVCLRSPAHLSLCRDEKQKGTQSCDWDPRVVRPAVRNLVRALKFYADPAKSCWIVPSPGQYALIVPALYGAMSFQRGYRRATVEEAERRGLIRLGADSEQVPVFDYEPAWLKSAVPHPIEGRTITATDGAQ